MAQKFAAWNIGGADGGANNNKNTLQHALRPFLITAQLFGVLPLSGLWSSLCASNRQSSVLRFRWCALAVLVTFVSISCDIIDLFLATRVVLKHGLKLYTAGPLSFSVICLIGNIVFLLLARKWPSLMKQTLRHEAVFLQPSYACHASESFSYKIRRLGSILLLCAVVEHLTYVSSAIYSANLQIRECNFTVDFWEHYFLRERLQIFSIVPYSVWLIPAVEWITIAGTFTWNFVDIFLMLIFRSFELRFQQLKWRIRRHTKQKMPADFWVEIRRDFLALTDLLTTYDRRLSGLVLLSCSHNMFFICVQVFHSLRHKGNSMNELYFWVSLTFVFIRFLMMMFSAAAVPEAALGISQTLFEIPSAFWDQELQRLNDIVVTDMVSVSGKGFFFLTRRLIFAMAGTIVVYELVLIDQVDDADTPGDICTRRPLSV